MKLMQKIIAFPFFFVAGLAGLLTFFIVEGFKLGYTHYKIQEDF